jgi:hypothetical protein
MHGLHHRVQVAVLEVTVDPVLFHAVVLDDVVAAPAQDMNKVFDLLAQVLRICLVMAASPDRLPVTWPPLRQWRPANLVGLDNPAV